MTIQACFRVLPSLLKMTLGTVKLVGTTDHPFGKNKIKTTLCAILKKKFHMGPRSKQKTVIQVLEKYIGFFHNFGVRKAFLNKLKLTEKAAIFEYKNIKTSLVKQTINKGKRLTLGKKR